MLTHPEAARALWEGVARFQAQISRPISADDADVRAALVSAVMLGVIVGQSELKARTFMNGTPGPRARPHASVRVADVQAAAAMVIASRHPGL